ncbi:GNAT family N-acetyltransferase [Oceanobacillus picturae]|uniref:GNAT family N-acetyltransferase n=1 Tax=Oceanobacillus picturae TaxID=171693 RepID=UPI000E694404|nr:GNAT family N-acetyltransferase [Oceanobacillus picturae]RIU94736.1 GNAT family N-acetyltransferase [Oceanobacillus picturae]
MRMRAFQSADVNQMVSLFYDTVHAVNARDYTKEQLNAWAPQDEMDAKLINWEASFARNISYIAETNDEIVGFGDMTHNGYLDRLFVHKNFQGKGIATALMNRLESEARKIGLPTIETEASITAKPFFERRGYQLIEPQTIERKGITLINFKMSKRLVSE